MAVFRPAAAWPSTVSASGMVQRGVLEREPSKRRCSTNLPAAGSPSSRSSSSAAGAIDLGLGHVLAGPRIVGQHARLAVQIPLARRVERLADELDVVPLVLLPVAHGPAAGGGELDELASRCPAT